MTTDAKLCFIDRDGVFQVIYGEVEDVRTIMTLVDDKEVKSEWQKIKISQQLVRVAIQARRGLSPAATVMGITYGAGPYSNPIRPRLKLIQGGAA